MNRSFKESPAGTRNIPGLSQHRRGRSLTGMPRDADENLDLFSRNRRALSVVSSEESEVPLKLGRLSVGSAKPARTGMDDLLSSVEGGKHDYDWLLTPPGTPLFPSSDGNESQPAMAAPRSSNLARSSSTTKASRLSVSQSENGYSSRPTTRSSSVTRPSISSSQYSTYSLNRSSSILNTSSASVSSYTRPSSPVTRSSSSVTRPSTPSSRPISSRTLTPSRSRPGVTGPSVEKPRPSPNSRPTTPSSRPVLPGNLSSPAARSYSRPSTPTRRTPTASLSPVAGPSPSSVRAMSNGRNSAPSSRPSSPGPRGRSSPQPIVLPDFPLDTPPNLRTTLPDRPLSAGRSRPGASMAVKGSSETSTRRQSSPIVSRGRVSDHNGRGRLHSNGHIADTLVESRKASHVIESSRKPVKTSTSTSSESTGFGRTISKKSLDMAIRHMDIRNGAGSIRPLSSATLFPQSIRSAASKTQSARASSAPASVNSNGNAAIPPENGNYFIRGEEDDEQFSAKLMSQTDIIYESTRYDAILLKEDLKNTNWLHSVDKSDQGPIFDNGFEQLPEPFGLL